jgi:hypothetical protein
VEAVGPAVERRANSLCHATRTTSVPFMRTVRQVRRCRQSTLL